MGTDYFDVLRDMLIKELGPRLLEQGLNLAVPGISGVLMDGIAVAIANWKKELPPETLALFE
jgi:hypothetical protein